MRILLTNDDGIQADGIFALYQELKKIGQVTVVAPDSQRSSVGHGITLAYPIWPTLINQKGKFFGHGISGTPADCVKFGMSVIMKDKPDIVISGINLGPNDGCSVFYSGTVAGAREGALNGIPSIAISLDTFVAPDFSYAAECGKKCVQWIHKIGLPQGVFLNINVPHKKKSRIKGVKMTRQGTVPIHGSFVHRRDPNLRDYYWMTGRLPGRRKNLIDDTSALHHDFVTVTPVTCDMTDDKTLNFLNNQPIHL